MLNMSKEINYQEFSCWIESMLKTIIIRKLMQFKDYAINAEFKTFFENLINNIQKKKLIDLDAWN